MKNYRGPGNVLTVAAPAAVVSGAVAIIGSIVGVYESDAASGSPVAVLTAGVFELPKVSAQAWTAGAKIYWDGAAGKATNVLTGNTLIGIAADPAANPSAVGNVKIGPTL